MTLRPTSLAVIACLTCLFLANDALAQRGGWGMGGRLEYLNNPDVQKELDMVDDQMESLEDIGNEAREIFRNAFSGMREKFGNMSRDERDEMMTEIRAKITEDMKDVEGKLGEVLLPHQMERLDQIVLQNTMKRQGTASALESLGEKFGLTPEEIEKVKAKEEEVRKEMEEEMKKIREKAQNDIFSVLPAEKAAKLKEALGKAFEMRQRGRDRGGRDRGGRGGDRGGRGGDRGGRGAQF